MDGGALPDSPLTVVLLIGAFAALGFLYFRRYMFQRKYRKDRDHDA